MISTISLIERDAYSAQLPICLCICLHFRAILPQVIVALLFAMSEANSRATISANVSVLTSFAE